MNEKQFNALTELIASYTSHLHVIMGGVRFGANRQRRTIHDTAKARHYAIDAARAALVDTPAPAMPAPQTTVETIEKLRDRLQDLARQLVDRDDTIIALRATVAELSSDDALNEAERKIERLTQLNSNQRDTIETLDKTIAGLRHAVNVLTAHNGNVRSLLNEAIRKIEHVTKS